MNLHQSNRALATWKGLIASALVPEPSPADERQFKREDPFVLTGNRQA
jgi:hypothetical protein